MTSVTSWSMEIGKDNAKPSQEGQLFSRESSFNMTSGGGGGGEEDIETRSLKF